MPHLLDKGMIIPNHCGANARVAYECDVVSDAKFKQTQGNSGRIELYEQISNSAIATINVLNYLDLYAVFGSGRSESNWTFTDSSDSIQRIETATYYGFLWGLGSRLVVYEWDALTLGITGAYRQLHNHPSYLTLNAANESTSGTRLQWRAWEVSGAISYNMGILIPYLGVNYSQARAEIGNFSVALGSNGTGTIHMTNRTPVGLLLGCSLTTGSYFFLNIEGRLFDEEAITISGEIRI